MATKLEQARTAAGGGVLTPQPLSRAHVHLKTSIQRAMSGITASVGQVNRANDRKTNVEGVESDAPERKVNSRGWLSVIVRGQPSEKFNNYRFLSDRFKIPSV
jgi:hypothetical protein